VPGGWLADQLGRPVPDPVAGELIIRTAGGDVPTGVWARRRADGTFEHLGERPGSADVWVAVQLTRDEAVTEAVVRGQRAWIAPPLAQFAYRNATSLNWTQKNSLVTGETGYGLVGYGILLFPAIQRLVLMKRVSGATGTIIRKYEAKIQKLQSGG